MPMDDLLRHLIDRGGSDLHLMAGLKPAIRIHGDLTPIEGSEPFTPDSIRELVYAVLTPDQIQLFETSPQTRNELDFAYGKSGLGRFRFNVHVQRGTVAVVARALSAEIPPLDSLGLPPSVKDVTHVHKGLALVTGPTGSGKSTTLAAIINDINENQAVHIITIEDPIEYLHNSKKSYVTQREVGDSGDTLSFRNALKYCLRQDPDVILVGEMRDYETIGVAITSAETGHLVFGTLHTPSAAQTIGRIIDVFPADQQPQVVTQLASNLVMVVSQILLPTADGKGRVVASEVMKGTTAIRNQIRTNSIDGIYQSIQTGSKEGMVTMDASILNHVRSGRVSYETAMPHIRDDVTRRQLEQFKTGDSGGGQEANGGPDNGSASQPSPNHNEADAPSPGAPSQGGRRGVTQVIPPWEKK